MDKDFKDELMIIDLMIEIKALESILISKNICTKDEILQEVAKVSESITKQITEKLKNSDKKLE